MELHQWRDAELRGKIREVTYTTLNENGECVEKYANVYLPYGYDEAKKYDVFYLMHGGGGNPDAWLDACMLKNALDRSFADKRAEPFIVVLPTYYNEAPSVTRARGFDMDMGRRQVLFFQKELKNDLIPAVESKFSTYAESTDIDGLRASRKHRAFGGFSMGGSTTWFAFLNNLDIIATFMPLSGDCWQVMRLGGKEATEETVKSLYDGVIAQGFGKDDFRIFAATGSTDIAYPNLTPQIEAMKKCPEMFEYSDDLAKGNLHYVVKPDAPHAYDEVYQHVYNYLPYLFGKA